MNNKKFQLKHPKILGVGLAKCGTSTVHQYLINSSEIHGIPLKEIRYLVEGKLVPEMTLFGRLLTENEYYKRRRKGVLNLLKKSVKGRKLSRIKWFIKYLFYPRSFKWYQSLFSLGKTNKTIDISPVYSRLHTSQIVNLVEILPVDVKILIFLRDPIDRIWSDFRMYLKTNKIDIEKLSQKEVLDTFENSDLHNPNYIDFVNSWKSNFKYVKILYFDELTDNPNKFYEGLCDFLDISFVETNQLKANQGQDLVIPHFLYEKFVEMEIPRILSYSGFLEEKYLTAWKEKHRLS